MCTELAHVWLVFCADFVGDFKGLQSTQFSSSVPFEHAWNMRPTFGVEDQVNAYKLQRLQDSFCKRHGICLPPLQTRFDYHDLVLLYKMRSSLAPPLLMHSSSPASFSDYGIFISKVRVPSSSHKKIINIGELCPTVDSPLERTSERNPRVQHVDQVQNPTKNPFTYLMSTVASFNHRTTRV